MKHIAVIGSGFAGLAAALRLVQAGAKVTVLDALSRAGGRAALGYPEFSSGPTIVTLPQIFCAFHQRITVPIPTLTPAQPVTVYTDHEGRRFAPEALHIAGDLEGTLEQLSKTEAKSYSRLLFSARRMYQDAAHTFLFAPPPQKGDLGRYALTKGLRAAPHLSLAQHVALAQAGDFLTPFWLRHATHLGADPYRAPAVLHNNAWIELGYGIWHLQGGLLALAQRLQQHAEMLGVRFEYDTRILHLSSHGGRVLGAHTNKGAFAADAWISATDRALTAEWLGLNETSAPKGISGFALQLRLNEDVGRGHYVYWSKDYKQEWLDIRGEQLPKDPTMYLHVDHDRAFVLVNAPAKPELSLQATEYAQFLFEQIQRRHPLPVQEWHALSPAQYERTGQDGALYGRAPHGLMGSVRPGWRFPTIRNLVQVGGSVHPGGGVPFSILSGWNGAGLLLKQPYDNLDALNVPKKGETWDLPLVAGVGD